MFDVRSLKEQQGKFLKAVSRASFRAAEAIGTRAEIQARVTSPMKSGGMRAGWYHRTRWDGEAVRGELGNTNDVAWYQEKGTGKWGPKHRPYRIVPRRKKWLSWVGGNGVRVFAKAVWHPGVKPRFIGYGAIFGRPPFMAGQDHSRNIAIIEREIKRAT
jgi:hypothetical protein